MKMDQKQPKQTEKDELLDMVIDQSEEITSQDSPSETTPRIIRVNPDQGKKTIHVTKNNEPI